MTVICRFAPSPTGYLHVGNVRTAIINWLFAKKSGGKFILRIDDTDKQRSKKEYELQIKDDMKWLGLEYDLEFNQSSRLAEYEIAKQKLIASGRLYPCYESQEELDVKRKIQLSRGKPPIYDRAALNLSETEIQNFEAKGIKPHYRFKLNHEHIEWDDLIRGKINFEGSNLSDPILIRGDNSMTYILCSVVDDIEYGITHIVRGEDHISNTAIAIQITEALGGVNPIFAHLSLLKSKDSGISKRDGGFDIKSLRESFIEPIAIESLLAKIGSSRPVELVNNLQELCDEFDFSSFSKSPAIYDIADLNRLNQKYLANAKFAQVIDNINKLGIDNIDESFFDAVKGNLSNIGDLKIWWQVCHTEINPVIDEADQDFLKKASDLLPNDQWDNQTWSTWISHLKEISGRKGKELFMPIRMALTGMESGPELNVLLPLLGRDKTIARLSGLKS